MPRKPNQYPEVLADATIRNFDGGLNVIDPDLNLSSKFSKVMDNVFRGLDGSLTVRWGTRLFTTLPSSPGRVVGMTYYNAFIISVTSAGHVYKTDGTGTTTQYTISPAWNACTFASFAQFNGELIICNGVSKPLLIKHDMTIHYLVDIPSGANTNTPIGKYVSTAKRFCMISGDPANPDRLYISNEDTSGTWRGDPLPNNAVNMSLGAWLGDDDYTIHGMKVFRGSVLIGFNTSLISGTIGQFDGSGNHTPDFSDAIQHAGGVSHHVMEPILDQLLMLDFVGVGKIDRTIFNSTLRPGRVSQLIDPDLQAVVNPLSIASLEDRCFAVYNINENQFMMFIPNKDSVNATTETIGYVYGYNPELGLKAWSKIRGWNFTAGCTSAAGRVFFGDANGKIWVYGSVTDPIYADFVNDSSVNADGTGIAINFDWELPWGDMAHRMRVKKTKFIKIDSSGTAKFTVQMYVDNMRTDKNTGFDTPQLEMDFVGGDANGYGGGTQPYGGGRQSSDERLWKWPAKFMIYKLRMKGSIKVPLKIISISLCSQRGSVRR